MIWFEKYKTVFIGAVVVVLALILYLGQPKDQSVAGSISSEMLDAEIPQITAGEQNEPLPLKIFVDLKGAVQNPGLYEATENDRVFDIIARSGGLLDHADEKQINYAQKVHDEMVIYIPRMGEILDNDVFAGSSPSKQTEKVNINKADSTELQTLPGIGPAKANAIIDFREQNGSFKQTEDLQKISGIGAKTFEKLQDLITVH
ncbi:helix-hairpin-helix domain-containing protein [Lederbergia citrea]|nr:helix-hairpin-helix domain-containing protein [Lederbergia citrea]MBS4176271.1 helix-hairpin-helix domain-containing protein [Lederbergia citrea]